jgi:molybdate transport system permease protein
MNWQAIWLTAKLASIVTLLLLVIAIPLAYWVAYSRARWKFLVEAVVALPLVLPPTVLGFYFLVAMGNATLFGRWWQRATGETLAFTFEGLVVASVFYSLPFAVQPIAAGFAAVPRRLRDASMLLGAGPMQTFRRVILPLSRSAILTGVVLTFAHTVGEFGVVLMVGGNIPGVTRTLSIDVYDKVQALDYAAANRTALALLVFSYSVLALVYATNRRMWPVGADR